MRNLTNLLKKVQGIGGIVHIIEALPCHRYQSKKCASSRRIAAVVEQLLTDLVAIWSDRNQEPVVPVGRQNVAIRVDRQPKRIVQTAALRNRSSNSGGSVAEHWVGNRCNAIVMAVRNIEQACVAAET